MACKTVQIVGQQVGALLAGNIMDVNNPLRIADIPAGFVIGNAGNGNAFIPIPGLTFPALGELTDVDTSTALTGDVLHRTATGDWGPITLGPVAFSGDYNDLRSLPSLVTSFTGLSDTPSTLGGPNQLLAMDAAGADLTFIDLPQFTTTFVALTDTPPALGGPDQFLAMNTAGTELTFVDLPQIPWDISSISKNDLLIWDDVQQLFVPTSINSVNHWKLKELDAVDTLFYDNRLVVIGDENAFSASRISEYSDVDLFVNRRILGGAASFGKTPRSVTPSTLVNAAVDVNANPSGYTMHLHSDDAGTQLRVSNQDADSALDFSYYGTADRIAPKYVGAISWADTVPEREKTFAFHALNQPVPATRLGAGWIRLDGRTTTQRPTSPITQEGMLMYNSETRSFEGYFSTDGTIGTLGWHSLYQAPGSVISSFLDLSDTPVAYTAGYYVRVNGSGNALIFQQGIPYTDVTGAPSVITNFLGLSDTPASYGTSGQVPAINSAGDGLTFVSLPTYASNFLELADTPSAFGTPGQIPQVNSAGNALEFVDQPSGVSSYLDLTDTPNAFNAGFYPRVNGAGDAIIFQDGIPFADLTGVPSYATNFLDLADTPGAYDTAGKLVAINTAGDGLVFIDPPSGGGAALWELTTNIGDDDYINPISLRKVVIGGTALTFPGGTRFLPSNPELFIVPPGGSNPQAAFFGGALTIQTNQGAHQKSIFVYRDNQYEGGGNDAFVFGGPDRGNEETVNNSFIFGQTQSNSGAKTTINNTIVIGKADLRTQRGNSIYIFTDNYRNPIGQRVIIGNENSRIFWMRCIGSVVFPKGTTAQEPAVGNGAEPGSMRFNTDDNQFYYYRTDAEGWVPGAQPPKGPAANRPGTAQDGWLYYNTDTSKLQLYTGGAWIDLN